MIEFQKRGLPHVHCIFILDKTSKNALGNPERVDTIISAELPPESDKDLRELVLYQMNHDLCESHNPASVYMEDRGCNKNFSKSFRFETEQSEGEHYISNWRRSRKKEVRQQRDPCAGNPEQKVDDSCLRMFHDHMNVELCVSRVGGIKYLFKYINKGSDRVAMEIVEDSGRYNEIEQFQSARYVSASEAAWRILACDIIDNDPPVYRLEVRTEEHHTVYFREGEGMPAALREPQTELTVWFKAKTKYRRANHLRYDDFPLFLTWVRSDKL